MPEEAIDTPQRRISKFRVYFFVDVKEGSCEDNPQNVNHWNPHYPVGSLRSGWKRYAVVAEVPFPPHTLVETINAESVKEKEE